MYVTASDNRRISLVSSCFGCRRFDEFTLQQRAAECVQTREIVLKSKHCNTQTYRPVKNVYLVQIMWFTSEYFKVEIPIVFIVRKKIASCRYLSLLLVKKFMKIFTSKNPLHH